INFDIFFLIIHVSVELDINYTNSASLEKDKGFKQSILKPKNNIENSNGTSREGKRRKTHIWTLYLILYLFSVILYLFFGVPTKKTLFFLKQLDIRGISCDGGADVNSVILEQFLLDLIIAQIVVDIGDQSAQVASQYLVNQHVYGMAKKCCQNPSEFSTIEIHSICCEEIKAIVHGKSEQIGMVRKFWDMWIKCFLDLLFLLFFFGHLGELPIFLFLLIHLFTWYKGLEKGTDNKAKVGVSNMLLMMGLLMLMQSKINSAGD
ncbi:hypothetical protein ACJX0J_040028, partial [Zea mays]